MACIIYWSFIFHFFKKKLISSELHPSLSRWRCLGSSLKKYLANFFLFCLCKTKISQVFLLTYSVDFYVLFYLHIPTLKSTKKISKRNTRSILQTFIFLFQHSSQQKKNNNQKEPYGVCHNLKTNKSWKYLTKFGTTSKSSI